MYNDVDIEMIELAQAANRANAQNTGDTALTAEIRERIIKNAVTHLEYTGGESSFAAVMSAVEDLPNVRVTSDDIGDMQWIAWERYQAEYGDNW